MSTTEPAGAPAQLRIDGQDKGALPIELDIEAGRHLIEVTRPGYRPWSKWLERKAGDDRTLELAMARADASGAGVAGGALPAAVGVAGVGLAAGGLALGAGGGGGGGRSSPGLGLGLGTGGSSAALTRSGAPPAAATPPSAQQAAPAQPSVAPTQPAPARPAPAAAAPAQQAPAATRPPPSATAPPVADKESMGERRKHTEGLGRLPTTTSLFGIGTLGGNAVVTVTGKTTHREYDSQEESSIEETEYGAGFRFGDLINPFVEVGASLYLWLGTEENAGNTDSNRFTLSPFLKIRVPVLPGPQGDLLEVYGLATGGLTVLAFKSDAIDDQKAAGSRFDEINFGWVVGGAAGAQLNVTRDFGLFIEGGALRSRVTIGISELNQERVSDGELVIDVLEPYVSFGLVFLNRFGILAESPSLPCEPTC